MIREVLGDIIGIISLGLTCYGLMFLAHVLQ